MKKKIRVLLVDDEQDFLEPISLWLESKGYSVTLAYNGKQTIQIVKSDTPDIVFLDIRMPVMDGIEILARIREFNKKIPVVMVTAYCDEKSLARARQLGVSGFFPKRESLEELQNTIETTLRTHKKLRSR